MAYSIHNKATMLRPSHRLGYFSAHPAFLPYTICSSSAIEKYVVNFFQLIKFSQPIQTTPFNISVSNKTDLSLHIAARNVLLWTLNLEVITIMYHVGVSWLWCHISVIQHIEIETKFRRRHFQMHFSCMKIYEFRLRFRRVCSVASNWQCFSIGLDNRRQAIIWTNDG